MRCHHVPAPKSDHDDWNEPAHRAANDFNARIVVISFTQPWPDLAADEPSNRPTYEPANQGESRSAEEQGGVPADDGRRDTDGKESPNGADCGASNCSQVWLPKRRVAHLDAMGNQGRGEAPRYSAVGLISRLLERCSMTWADQPETRAMTKMGVNMVVGIPQK